jgi:RNA polymerase sigma-70 factor (ECF subfamily)
MTDTDTDNVTDGLAERFERHLSADERPPWAADALDARLGAILTEARQTWPGVALEDDTFWAFLARRMPPDRDVLEVLEELKSADLYLACACLNGDDQAARAFEKEFFPVLDRALSGICGRTGQVDDVKQSVYQKVFVGEEGRDAAIHKYDGVGDLRAWVRVTAVRMALNLKRDGKRERPLSPEILATIPKSGPGPEEDYLKRVYSDAFKQAFGRALAALDHKQRNLLRYYYIDGLTVEQIGRIYRVHKATISRRLGEIRELLLTETRNSLVRELDVSRTEFDSIMRLIQSRMDISIFRFLKPED